MASLLVLQTCVDEGLGACFFGVPGEKVAALRAAFGVPEGYRPVGCLSIGYPDADEERSILLRSVGVGDPVERMRPVLDPVAVLALQERVETVHAEPSIVDYLMEIVAATRADGCGTIAVLANGVNGARILQTAAEGDLGPAATLDALVRLALRKAAK